TINCHLNTTYFITSRRRHTKSYGDWSSDVCSSDLPAVGRPASIEPPTRYRAFRGFVRYRLPPRARVRRRFGSSATATGFRSSARSEERRVGIGGGTWWGA